MTLSLEKVEQFLNTRNDCFINADLDGYLDLWSDDGIMEFNAFVFKGKNTIKDTTKPARRPS